MEASHYKLGGTAINKRPQSERQQLDSYFTPPVATKLLLEHVNFEGGIWECASGVGHMSKVLEERGFEVMSSDLRPDAYGESGIDFLATHRVIDNIVTNPPYAVAEEFVRHALDLAQCKVAMLLRLAYLESAKRYSLFKTTPLAQVIVLSKRLPHWNGVGFAHSGQFSHAWFVWDKTPSYQGKTTIDWAIDRE